MVGAVLGYDLVNLYGNHASSSLEKEIILGAKHLPLWSNLRCAVNPDRAFFELADERHNEPLLFHSGLYVLDNAGPLMRLPVLFLTKLLETLLTSLMRQQLDLMDIIDLDFE